MNPKKNYIGGFGLYSFGTGWVPVTSSSEHGFGSSGSTKTETFPSDY